jgi:uncharacterized membrane protein YhaH (DUF805 family)
MVGRGLHTTLTIVVADAWYWEALRLFDIVTSAFLLAFVFKRIGVQVKRIDVARQGFWGMWAMYALVQEAQQLHQPVLVWRAPYIAVMDLFAIWIMWELEHAHSQERLTLTETAMLRLEDSVVDSYEDDEDGSG